MQLPAASTKNIGDLALALLRQPGSAVSLTLSDWDTTLRVLRSQGVLARLHVQLEKLDLLSRLPEKIQEHLFASRVVADDHERMIHWEVDRICYALRNAGISVVLLKGAAYVAADLPPARGRLVSDVDILVAESDLLTVEAALIDAGWESMKRDEYDQRYYRQWMHEIPPLRHALRQTDVDVHHAILPRTARIRPDPGRLLAASEAIQGDNLRVLSPPDMVLHSATHLFYDGDLDHGLRDLLDLHDLLIHFSTGDAGFWAALVPRACELELQRPLFYALRYCRRYLHTDIPETVIESASVGSPGGVTVKLMDMLVSSALQPRHPGYPRLSLALQHGLLYVRSHYIRMPLRLLIPHLARKAVFRETPQEKAV